ncbi:MAG: RNA polymerase sigma factor [Planctomycetota bacterium]
MPAPHISVEQLLQQQDWLHRFVRQMVRDDFSADDLVQATLAEALENPDAGRINLRSWLAGTARNLVRNQWRSNSRRQSWEEKVAIPVETIRNQSAELADYFAETNKAVADLPELERKAIMYRYLQDMKPREIAVEMGVPVQDVYRLLENSRGKLRQRLVHRYGKDWQAMGLGLLGLPTGAAPLAKPGTTTFWMSSPRLALGAVILISVGAGAFLLSDPGKSDQNPQLDTPLAAAASGDQDVQDTIRQDHVSGTQAATHASGLRVMAEDALGQPLADTELNLNYADGSFLGLDISAQSDAQGQAHFDIPTDAEGIHLSGYANGYWSSTLSVGDFTDELCRLTFFEGVYPVELDLGLAPAGTTIRLEGHPFDLGKPQITGQFLVQEAGMTMVPLPDYGEYQVSIRSGGQSHSTLGFPHTRLGRTLPISLDYQLVESLEIGVYSSEGTPLTNAQFLLQRHVKDPLAFHEFVYEPISTDRGRLSRSVFPVEWRDSLLLIQCDGYRSAVVDLSNLQIASFPVFLDREETISANLVGGGNGIPWASLQMEERVPVFQSQAYEGSTTPNFGGHALRSLVISEDGTFQLPRTPHADSGDFSLVGTKVDGTRFDAVLFSGKSRAGVAPEFHLQAVGESVSTFSFPDSPSFANSRYVFGFASPGPSTWERIPLEPISEFDYQLETAAGDYISVGYGGGGLKFSLYSKLPEGVVSGHFEVPDYSNEASLSGKIRLGDGTPLPDGTTFKSRFLGDLPKMGFAPEELPSSLDVDVTQKDGEFFSPGCPPGNYLIEVFVGNRTREFPVNTSTQFDIRLPEFNILVAGVTGYNTGEDIKVSVHDALAGNQTGSQANLAYMQPSELELIAHIPVAIPFSNLVLKAPGWQPATVAHAIPELSLQVTMKKGRKARTRIDVEARGMLLNPENRWVCSAWGSQEDPRHSVIRVNGNTISCSNFPPEAFDLIEINPQGTPTGQVISVEAED